MITISQAVKRDVVATLRVPAERVDVGYLGFGMRRDAAPTPAAELRARFGLGDGRVVLCVSAALAHKNLDTLIDALARLRPGTRTAASCSPATPAGRASALPRWPPRAASPTASC